MAKNSTKVQTRMRKIKTMKNKKEIINPKFKNVRALEKMEKRTGSSVESASLFQSMKTVFLWLIIKVANNTDCKREKSTDYKPQIKKTRHLDSINKVLPNSPERNHQDECSDEDQRNAEVVSDMEQEKIVVQENEEENSAQPDDIVFECKVIRSLDDEYNHDKDMNVYTRKDEYQRCSEVSINAREEETENEPSPILDGEQENNFAEESLKESDNYEIVASHEAVKSNESNTEVLIRTEAESETNTPCLLYSKVQEYDAVEQEKQCVVMQVLENTDIKSENNNVSKKPEGEAEESPEGRAKTSLMAELFSMKYFRIKPQNAVVFMLSSASRLVRNHPKALGDIPWSWLREEKWRLHTFSNYPHNTTKSAILLASEGFAYTGSGKDKDDSVICYFCCGTKKGWLQTDVISVVHKALSPNCSMVTGVNCDNIPMSAPKNGSGLFSSLMDRHEKPRKGSHGRGGDEIESDGAGPAVDSHRRNYDQIQTDAAPETQQVSEARPSREPASSNKPKMLQLATSSVARPSAQQTASSQTRSSTVTTHQASNSNVPSSTVTSGHSLARPSGQSEAPNRQRVSSSNNLSTATSTAQAIGQSSHVSSSTASSSSARTAAASTSTAQPQASTDSTSRPPAPASSTPTAPSTSATTNQTANTQAEQGSTSQGSSQNSQGTSRPPGRGPTYGDLGIITERPKRYEYAVKARRLETFEHWPRDHHLKKEDLSAAGFYYAGYGDCARCFYCGGGLRNWEDDDNVWVEHARWFPKCAFIRQQMGQAFVDTVQDLNKDHDQISYKMVTEKMGTTAISFQLDSNNVPLKRDPAVRTVIDMGYHEKDVLEAAAWVKENHTILSSDKLFERLESEGKLRIQKTQVADSQAVGGTSDPSKDKETMETLKDQNSQLRQQTVCKICMDKEVAVVFLPCGHLVSCTDCAAAMKDCPVCRNHVKGIVRAFMS